MIGMSVIEMMHKIDKNEHKDVMMAASLLKLTVENFVLHLKLKNKI